MAIIMSGYTRSYRDKWSNPVFRNLLECGIWSWMCDSAVWRESKIRYNNSLVILQRGQLITSVSFISKGFGIGEQVTRTFLDNIEKDGMINKQPTNQGTLITICNYDKYHQSEDGCQQATNKRPTSVQQTPNNNKKEDKEYNIYLEDNIYMEDNIHTAAGAGAGAKKTKASIILPEWLPTDDWKDFIEMRKKAKKSPTDQAQKLLLADLDKLRKSGHDLTQALQQSTKNNWLSIYAIKGESTNARNRNSSIEDARQATIARTIVEFNAKKAKCSGMSNVTDSVG
jgi:hypothetical protein